MEEKKVVVIGAGSQIGHAARLISEHQRLNPTPGITHDPTKPNNKVPVNMRSTMRTAVLLAAANATIPKAELSSPIPSRLSEKPDKFHSRNVRTTPIVSRKVGYLKLPHAQKTIHDVIESNDLHAINKSKNIKEYWGRHTIVQTEKFDNISSHAEYTFVMLEVPYNVLLNKTKSFKFKGTKQEVLYKQIIMFIYMDTHKHLKETIVGLSQLGEGVTRGNFTKVLSELSTDVKALFDSVIEERLKDYNNNPLNFW